MRTTNLTYNAGNASDAEVLADLLGDEKAGKKGLLELQPLGLSLQEVNDRRKVLQEAAKRSGYELFQFAGPAKGHVALLVRADAKAHNPRVQQISKREKLSPQDAAAIPGARKDGHAAAKFILAVDVTEPKSGKDLTLAAVHFIPGASHNATASRILAEQARNAADWLAAQPLPTDLSGDCNGRSGRHEFAPLRKVATPISAPSRKGAAIDIHWVTDASGTGTALDGYSSDHKPVKASINFRTTRKRPAAHHRKPAAKKAPAKKVAKKRVAKKTVAKPAVVNGKVQAPAPPYVGPAAHTSAGSNQPVTRVVIHSTVSPCEDGGARATAAYFRTPASGGSAHYVVDPGEAVQVVWDDTIAWHAPPNPGSIGVELCDEPANPNGTKAPVTRWHDANHTAMLQRAAELVAQLCLAYHVPIRKIGPKQLLAGAHGICGHVDVSQAWGQSDHWDPGHFPWKHFIGLVRAAANDLQGKQS